MDGFELSFLAEAGFDEKITVVELVIKALINVIKEYQKAKKTSPETISDIKADTAKAMESAFAFVEDAFGEGQEMILFVTELTRTLECALFLVEVPNEKYLKYSEEYLTDKRKQELLNEIEQGWK